MIAHNSPFIEVRDLYFCYQREGSNSVPALQGVSLALHPGEFVVLVGANGSGKTTLARHLNALLSPTRGEVRVAGLVTSDPSNWPAIRSHVAMIFQRPEDQIVATTVEDDVAFGPENLGLAAEEIENRVGWALESVGLWPLRHRPPHLLSAGQQQKVAIAGALAMRPRCLVLDEATAMLDPAGRRELLALLRKLHGEGMTIISITHRMSEATTAERVIALAEGRVAFDGTPRQLFADRDWLVSLGLEFPPLRALAAQLSRRWPGFPPDLLTIDELVEAILPRLPQGDPAPAPLPDPLPARADPLVVVRDLQHTYLLGTPLAANSLASASLQVYPGETAALLGPTGSGKSTLLQHIAGLLRPQAGEVLVDGRTGCPYPGPVEGRKQVGMLFQRPEEQLFETYVGDDVAFGPRQLGLEPQAIRERVRWAMEMVDLPFDTYKDRFTQDLSGGESHKAALAGVLALRPQVLLLDEPTAGLDPHAHGRLLDRLRRLNRQEGMTLLVATHAMEDVAAVADRAFILNQGRTVAQGTPRQLFGDSGLMAAHGLDVPEITALMHRLRTAGAAVPTDLLTVQEAVMSIAAVAARGC